MTISVQRLVTAALLLVGVAAPARAQGVETVTNVPFEFTAGDTNLPRDQYRISPMPGQNGAFMVRGLRHGVVLMSRTDRSNDREPAPSLTFHRYGDQYFLVKCSSAMEGSCTSRSRVRRGGRPNPSQPRPHRNQRWWSPRVR